MKLAILVCIFLALFLLLPTAVVLAQDGDAPTDPETPIVPDEAEINIEDAEDLSDTPPDAPLPNDDPFADAYKAIGLFLGLLITSGTFVSATVEKFVKPVLTTLTIDPKSAMGKIIVYVSALVIGIFGALGGQINAFSVVPYPFFSQWDANVLYVASGVAFAFSAFLLYDLSKLRGWFTPAG